MSEVLDLPVQRARLMPVSNPQSAAFIAEQLAQTKDRVSAGEADIIKVTQNKTFELPDKTEVDQPLHCIVVDYVSSNAFYEGRYDPKDFEPPACFAISPKVIQMVPSANSLKPQSEACDDCPKNKFGSDGNGKACKNQRLLAILPIDGDLDAPLMVIKASPTAIKRWDTYVTNLCNRYGAIPSMVETIIHFDKGSRFASLTFTMGKQLDEAAVNNALSRQEEARARLLREPNLKR